MNCYICNQPISPSDDKAYVPVTHTRERAVHKGCKQAAKHNERQQKV